MRFGKTAESLRSHTQRRDIQGLRALAVFLVVAYHAELPIPGGFIGVDVFFAISGFVITAMLLRDFQANKHVSMAGFFSRRVKRLFPALAVMVTIVAIISIAVGSPFNGQQGIAASTGIAALTATANIYLIFNSGGYFATPPASNPLLNTWSLSVEEQFYLVFPLLLIALWYLGNSRGFLRSGKRMLVLGISSFGATSLALCWALSTGRMNYRFSDPLSVAFYSSPTRAWEFAAGALLAVLVTKIVIPQKLAMSMVVVGWIGILYSAFVIHSTSVFPGLAAVIPIVATVSALAGGAFTHDRFTRAVSSRTFVWLGDTSYSWYLWHWPLISFALVLFPGFHLGPLLAATVGLVIARISLIVIENPIRLNPRIKGKRLAGVGLGFLAIGVSACLALLLGAQNQWGNSSIKYMAAQVNAQHAWMTHNCNSNIPLGQRGEECIWNSTSTGSPLYLVGDSQAGMLSEALIGSSKKLMRPLYLGTKGACPFIDANIYTDSEPDTQCRDFFQLSLNWLTESEPGTVVISNWQAYVTLPWVGMSLGNGQPTYDESKKLKIYQSGLDKLVAELRAVGHEVVLVKPIPAFNSGSDPNLSWFPYQCSTWTAITEIGECGVRKSREIVAADSENMNQLISRVAEKRGAVALSLDADLCSASQCETNDGNFWSYLDGNHISVGMSELLIPKFNGILAG